MPLRKSGSKGQEPADSSSSLIRTLKRANSSKSPVQSAPSKGKARILQVDEQQLKLGRRDNPENHKSASSSRTTSMTKGPAPESRPKRHRTSPELTEILETLSTAIAKPTGNEDVPSPEHEPTSASRQSESTFLVQKIRGLINSLPALSSRFLPSPKDPPVLASDGCPIPPPGAVRIQDPELISLLSNSDIMNGSDGKRQSVWSMLDAIKPPSLENAESIDEAYGYAGSDRSSVMMYSPLIPTADSVIELAELEDVPIVQSGPSSGRWLFTSWSGWPNFWPFNGWKAKDVTEEQDANPAPISTTISVPGTEPRDDSAEERSAISVRRVWVPSTTQLSFETTWWGYRIYLPPPVLAILDDQSVEAAKQATVITAALTWFFSNLPISSFPPPVQPAMILLQRLVPLVSYLGTFISWSWSTIRGFDRGHGVILTATWLLPIALIPGTWHVRDIPPPLSAALPPLDSVSAVSPEVDVIPDVEAGPSNLNLTPPASIVKPLPPSPEETSAPPPPLKQRKSSTSGKSKIKTLRKLTRTFS